MREKNSSLPPRYNKSDAENSVNDSENSLWDNVSIIEKEKELTFAKEYLGIVDDESIPKKKYKLINLDSVLEFIIILMIISFFISLYIFPEFYKFVMFTIRSLFS